MQGDADSNPVRDEKFFFHFRDMCQKPLKVAEHSFRARFADVIQRVHKDWKTNMSSIEWSFYLLNIRTICANFLHYWTQCIDAFSLLLQRYVRKVTTQRTQQFSPFSFLPKEPN